MTLPSKFRILVISELMDKTMCANFNCKLFFSLEIQCPLGSATLDTAAALGLATATPLTDLRQYINSDLGFSDLEI